MDTIVCPKCGTEKPANIMNGRHCRINLQFAIEHPDQIASAKFEAAQQDKLPSQQATFIGKIHIIVLALVLLLVCGTL